MDIFKKLVVMKSQFAWNQDDWLIYGLFKDFFQLKL